jgi:hypothetical protein
MCGVVAQGFIFVLTALFSKRLPGGYWFLLIGPVIDGCLGGKVFQLKLGNRSFFSD